MARSGRWGNMIEKSATLVLISLLVYHVLYLSIQRGQTKVKWKYENHKTGDYAPTSSNQSASWNHVLESTDHELDPSKFVTLYDSKDWVGIDTPYLYVYSAIFDDRVHYGEPRVVVIGVIENAFKGSLYCSLSTTAHKTYVPQSWKIMSDTRDTVARVGTTFKHIADFLVWCPIKEGDMLERVTIAIRMESSKVFRECATVKIFFPNKPALKHSLGLCVPQLYKPPVSRVMGNQRPLLDNPFALVEWLEMQRILGVGKVIFYVQAVGVEVLHILQYYSRLGFVTIHTFGLINGNIFKYPRNTASSDCMHRHMREFDMIMNIDVDEVIVPREYIQLPEMLKQISKSHNTTVKGNHFQFANDFYYTDMKPDQVDFTKPVYATYLRHRFHAGPQEFPGPMKSIQDPLHCKYTSNHQCLACGNKGVQKIFVHSSVASLHHYKACESSREFTVKSKCDRKLENSKRNDIMLRYEKQLLSRTSEVLKSLRMIKL